jgi:hypothetical protein
VDWRRQTRFSDPGRHASLLDPLPADVAGIGAVVRNIYVHYRASGIDFPPDRLAEVDNRTVERILATDRSRTAAPLADPRAPADRVAGCCRDATLLTVAALRAKGIPARSRVGFADYLMPGFHCDHVVTEVFDGGRWIATDTGVDRAEVPLGPGGLRTAAQVWTAYRRGEVDPDTFGVAPRLPFRGAWLISNYVIFELAHRRGDELLLWDCWGAVSTELGDDLEVIDEIAALLLEADAGDAAAERELARRYAGDPRLRPGERVVCRSPSGADEEVVIGRAA